MARFMYDPPPDLFVPGYRPGQKIRVTADEADRYRNNPCFTEYESTDELEPAEVAEQEGRDPE